MDTTISPLRRCTASHEPIEAARAWLEEFDRIAMATVIATWGSSPVPVGGQLIIAPGDLFAGSVSGGCVDTEVIAEAADVIATLSPRVLEFGVSRETALHVGLPCGGKIEIFLEPLQSKEDAGYVETILDTRRCRTPLVVEKDLSNGHRRIYDGTGELPQEVAFSLRSGESQLLEGACGRVFLHALAPALRIIIIGATQIGQVLSDLAQRIGCQVAIVDPRSAFASRDRFHDVDLMADWPEQSLTALGLDGQTAVVALTHVGHIDDEALIASLRSNCFYVGALGSKISHLRRLERLRSAGASNSELARIRAPVGLAIGANGPEEIAVSILAEIIKDRRGARS